MTRVVGTVDGAPDGAPDGTLDVMLDVVLDVARDGASDAEVLGTGGIPPGVGPERPEALGLPGTLGKGRWGSGDVATAWGVGVVLGATGTVAV